MRKIKWIQLTGLIFVTLSLNSCMLFVSPAPVPTPVVVTVPAPVPVP
jgi:hypothetical protein